MKETMKRCLNCGIEAEWNTYDCPICLRELENLNLSDEASLALSSESQREADVLRDEMAAHADYRERAQAGQTTEDDEEIYGHGDDSESDCEAAGTADEKPDGQAENAHVDAQIPASQDSESITD